MDRGRIGPTVGTEPKLLKDFLIPIHRAGWPFIAIGALATLVLFAIFPPLAWVMAILTAFCVFFFRDPERIVPVRPGLVVSPADGLVSAVDRVPPPPELDMGSEPVTRISVFLSVFDVHINRVPCDGTITELAYNKGKFLNASLDKASVENERQAVRLTLDDGRHLAVVQIAGLIARRIVCELRDAQKVRGGERFGLIRFGSRTDLYLPDGISSLVAVGQRMIGGETVMADLTSAEPQRPGEAR
jgi:phosphatidylserine decarboxylase